MRRVFFQIMSIFVTSEFFSAVFSWLMLMMGAIGLEYKCEPTIDCVDWYENENKYIVSKNLYVGNDSFKCCDFEDDEIFLSLVQPLFFNNMIQYIDLSVTF